MRPKCSSEAERPAITGLATGFDEGQPGGSRIYESYSKFFELLGLMS